MFFLYCLKKYIYIWKKYLVWQKWSHFTEDESIQIFNVRLWFNDAGHLFFLKDDLSIKKNAKQSVTLPGNFYAWNAVDRNIKTCTRANEIGTSSQKTVWWRVDLGGTYNIHDINILFETYDGFGIILYISLTTKNACVHLNLFFVIVILSWFAHCILFSIRLCPLFFFFSHTHAMPNKQCGTLKTIDNLTLKWSFF